MEGATRGKETYGIRVVTPDHSNHFGMAATYVLQAHDAGMIPITFAKSAGQMPTFRVRKWFKSSSVWKRFFCVRFDEWLVLSTD